MPEAPRDNPNPNERRSLRVFQTNSRANPSTFISASRRGPGYSQRYIGVDLRGGCATVAVGTLALIAGAALLASSVCGNEKQSNKPSTNPTPIERR